MAVQRFTEEQAGEQRGDERRGAEHQQDVGDRRQPERQDEGDEAARQQERAQQKRRPGIADVDQQAATLPEEQWQHGGNQQGRTPKRYIPGRQLDAAHDDARRAEDRCSAHGIEDAQRGGTRRTRQRCHAKQTVNTDSTCPRPSIPSNRLICRRSGRAFRGGARTCRPSRCSSAPTNRIFHRTRASACVSAWPIAAVTFWWACSTARQNRRPAGPW